MFRFQLEHLGDFTERLFRSAREASAKPSRGLILSLKERRFITRELRID
jgi:hypothetical protein